jgi:hypothetical protein
MRLLLAGTFFLLVAAARLPVLLAHLDTWYPFEVHCGTIATALADGVAVDWATLPIVSHARGNVVFGLLLMPLYDVFGASSLTMKLVPLLWHAATAALLVALLARYVNRFAALAAGLLLVFAPPAFAKLSVLGLASHMESTLPFLLALGAWLHMTTERRFGPLACFAFGAAVGFAAFFHVQALLLCLVLLGLLLLAEPRALGARGVLALALGFGLCAAPSLAFEGGTLEIVQASLGSGAGEAAAPGTPGPLDKVAGLLGGGFTASLEYGELDGPLGSALGVLATGALFGLALLAAGLHRQQVADLLARVVRRRESAPPGPVPPLLLYTLVLVAAFAVSHADVSPHVGTGAANRYIAPLQFTLLVLAAIALGALAARGKKTAAAGLLVLAVLPGALALPAISTATPATALPQRGECYEWFSAQLAHAGEGRCPSEIADLIARIDRGDPRFRTLRFRVNLVTTPLRDERFLEKEQRAWAAWSRDATFYALTSLGNALGNQLKASNWGPREGVLLRDPTFWRKLDRMDELEATALLHGIGLALTPPQRLLQDNPRRLDTFLASIDGLLRNLPPRFSRSIAEGYGFMLGSNFDPYNLAMHELVTGQSKLSEPVLDPVCTGLGWGARQRYVTPPRAVPEGLALLDCVPVAHRDAFALAFTGEVLPAEASLFGE